MEYTPEEILTAGGEAKAVLSKFKRLYTVSAPSEQSEQLAIQAMTNVLLEDAVERGQSAVLASVSIGSVSASYREPDPKKLQKRLFEAATMYLDIGRGCG